MSDTMLLYVNGQRLQVGAPDVDPEMTLLRFLRDQGLTGTKLG
jgi:aerobic-type carbon monoxide dehydrogenase small subunit (CoxS/CutS family)